MRLSRLLAKRVTGLSLRQIGQEESPPISLQAVAQLIGRAVSEMVAEPLEQVRRLELFRLDKLLAAVWEGAMGGDIACVDRCLAIMARRVDCSASTNRSAATPTATRRATPIRRR